MKRLLSLVLILASVLCFCSCAKEHKSITDISEYDAVWTLPDRKASGSSFLFPTSINAEDVLSFSCDNISTFASAEWQVVLELKYDADSFELESDKISSLCKGSPVFGDNDLFPLPAYASVWNSNECFEYAILNSESLTVTYVYLQNKSRADITLDSSLVPDGYSPRSDTDQFSIY